MTKQVNARPAPADMLSEERETHFNMTGDNHSEWVVFTDDPYWIRRLDKIGAVLREYGAGKEYILSASQVTVRAKPKELSAAEKERRATVMRQVRAKNAVNSLDSDTSNQEPDSLDVEAEGML
jgi:K+/H+ antiporter YhaU regulatory subunit KhtT